MSRTGRQQIAIDVSHNSGQSVGGWCQESRSNGVRRDGRGNFIEGRPDCSLAPRDNRTLTLTTAGLSEELQQVMAQTWAPVLGACSVSVPADAERHCQTMQTNEQ
jgi:hypothetical protein